MYYKNFNVLLKFLVGLYYFWNNLRQISSINIYSIAINGNRNTGSCEFCVKILNRECREVPKSYGFGERLPTNCMKQISSNQKFWYYQIIFSLTTWKLSFMSANDHANLYIFTRDLFIVCQMTQCIVLKVQCFYLRRSKGPLVLLSIRG